MKQFFFFLGKALQIIGLGTITFVVFMFFTQQSMETLLYLSMGGAVNFYGGTLILDKVGKES
jgi:hypothetical protein